MASSPLTWKGFLRSDGRAGVRNDIYIIPTVGCINGAVENIKIAFIAKHPEMAHRVMALSHPYGCSQLGDDLSNTRRLLAGLASNPNAGGVLVIGLGCENNRLAQFLPLLSRLDQSRLRSYNAQEVSDDVAYGLSQLEELYALMPYFIGNPIYQWTHLELRRYFGVTKLLCKENADEIYQQCNEVLKTLTPRKMMEKFNVATVYTTDDPVDDLHYHELMAKDKTLKTKVLPCWRPDKALNVERSSFVPWIKQLETVSGQACPTLKEMLTALDGRMKFFVDHGCAATDHALDVVHFKKGVTYEEANLIYQKGRKGLPVSFEEEDAYKGFVMLHLGHLYHRYNLVMQLHIGALRNNSERNFLRMGPDTGYDAVEDLPFAEKLAHFLSELDSHGHSDGRPAFVHQPK